MVCFTTLILIEGVISLILSREREGSEKNRKNYLVRLRIRLRRNARESFSQLVVPAVLRFEILPNVHDHIAGAHFGLNKTFSKLKQRYYWKGMFKDVEHWVKSCVECSMRKFPQNSKKAPLLPIPVEGAFDRMAVGVLGPFPPSSKGSRYIVVFSDYLTR